MRLTQVFFWVLLAGFLFGVGRIIEQGVQAQWDFGVYYVAGKSFYRGLSPYVEANLISAWPDRPSRLPFVYPPVTLLFFSLLSFWTPAVSVWIWGTAKALALVAWILVLRSTRLFSKNFFNFQTLFIFTVAFQSPILLDFKAGNVSVFESLLLWGALALFLSEQFTAFAILIAILAQFKVFTAAFALLPFLIFGRARMKATFISVGLTALFASFNFLFFGNWMGGFFTNQTPLSEHGLSNPSSYAFSGALLGVLNGIWKTPIWDLGGWCVLVGFWIYSLYQVLRSEKLTPLEKTCAAVLVYALCVPRFKDYSYALILPAAALAFQAVTKIVKIEEFLLLGFFLFFPASLENFPKTWFSRAFTEYSPYVGLALLTYFWLRTLRSSNSKKLEVKSV